MKKLFRLIILLSFLVLSISFAQAEWAAQYPASSMIFPYVNTLSGFQTFILISNQDTSPDWGGSHGSPSVVVKFNPKCGRGNTQSASLTTKQTVVITPPPAFEGWVEAFVKGDISDESADANYPVSGMSVILDISNGVAYSVKSVQWLGDLSVGGSGDPDVYGCNSSGACSPAWWGGNINEPIVASLWRNSNYGRTMFVLCDPSGRHINELSSNNTTINYLPNMAQLDIYSKSESDTHLSVEWCTGADAGKPGIVTIGVGTTEGPLGVTDTSVSNPIATMTDAPYGFAQAFNLRQFTWIDINGDGNGDSNEDFNTSHLLGAVFTRISNTYFPKAVEAHPMILKWTTMY